MRRLPTCILASKRACRLNDPPAIDLSLKPLHTPLWTDSGPTRDPLEHWGLGASWAPADAVTPGHVAACPMRPLRWIARF